MAAELEFTGERFIPGLAGSIAYEHEHRYAFALRHARGRRVLDAACGEGYGTSLLATVAPSAIGIDISEEAVTHARAAYAGVANARYEIADVTALPLAPASVDLVVSFETIEHLAAADQPRMLAEFARVLAPDGMLILSSPNRRRYSDARDYHNPFHLHELDRDELAHLLDPHFPARHWHHQTPIMASVLWSEASQGEAEAWIGDGRTVIPAPTPDGLYYLVIAAKSAAALPPCGPRLSLFHDAQESELARAEAAQAEVIRLDGLLHEREATLDARAGHVAHLEELVAYRERLIEERDAQLAACNSVRESHETLLVRTREELAASARHLDEHRGALAQREGELATARTSLAQRDAQVREARDENHRLEAAVAAQERIIAYRESARWWLQLPWVRARSWWQRRVQP